MARRHANPDRNECERLAELHRLDVLDTPPEAAFDTVTRLAARIFDVPIALVSLIDESRQWFKSRFGLDAPETPRDISFCTHAIRQDRVYVVEDAREHPLFADNPLVLGPPRIRFYAGAPLTTRIGYNIGTLCIIDRAPRPNFDDEERKTLADLAAIVVDEFDLRLANAEIGRERRRAKAADRAKAVFVANLSHEIRTPIFAISSVTELALATAKSRRMRDYLEKIAESNRVLLGLIDNVFDLSHIEAEKLTLDSVPFDLSDVVGKLTGMLRPRAERKALLLETHVDPGVPDTLVGDPVRLLQVLANLVGNAIKFTEKGGIDVSVSVRRRRKDRVALDFAVRDTGIGIPDDRRDGIFDLFTQGEISAERRAGSAGLGLTISKRLVGLMGGALAVASEPGRGSTFSFNAEFSMPVPSRARSKPAALPSKGAPTMKGLRILLADDNDVSREAVTGLLRVAGAAVDSVGDGEAAVRAATEAEPPYDAVLMDVQMPKMDGIAATRAIRRSFSADALPIVGLTARAFVDDRDRCLEAGMTDYLSKPATWERISNALLRRLHPKTDADSPPPVGDAVRKKAAKMFAARYARAGDEVRAALDAGDPERAARFLHALRGAAHYAGAADVAASAKELERAVSEGSRKSVMPSLEAFERVLGAALPRMRAAKTKRPSVPSNRSRGRRSGTRRR